MALLQAKTEYGIVEGVMGNSPRFTVFKGVPYMKPPVGAERWKKPSPPEKWDGVLRCDRYRPTCLEPAFDPSEGGIISREFFGVRMPMDEDFMYLNITTPAESPDEKLPVCVYIHGGGFTVGYSYLCCYDGEGFAKRGVVYVTIPYRLNVFGFMAHPELTEESGCGASGNYAFLDQVWALEWIRRNIAAFGGDPDNISIFGQSAGAMSVNAMCATPLSAGLIRRAVLQSGGGIRHTDGGLTGQINPWTRSLGDAEQLGEHFLRFIGCRSISEARQLSGRQILDGFIRFGREKLFESDGPTYVGLFTRFGPVYNDGYVFPRKKNDLYFNGLHHDIDYMIGSTSGEWKSMTADNRTFAENQIELGRRGTYVYYFDYVPAGAEAEGSHHSVEHYYVFQTLDRSPRRFSGFDYELSNELADRWAAFFRTGSPNAEGLPVWTPYDRTDRRVLLIRSDGCHMGPYPEGAFGE